MKIISQTSEIVHRNPPADMLLFGENGYLPKGYMQYTDFCNTVKSVSGSEENQIFIIKPNENVTMKNILECFSEKVNGIRDEYLYKGFKDWLKSSPDQIRCERVFIPAIQMYGRLNGYVEHYTVTEKEWVSSGYTGTITEGIYNQKNVELRENVKEVEVKVDKTTTFQNLNILTDTHISYAYDKLFPFYDMRDRTENELLKENKDSVSVLCSQEDYKALLEKAKLFTSEQITKIVKKRAFSYSDVNWNWIYPEIVLQPVWVLAFTYQNVMFTSLFSENEASVLELPYQKSEQTKNTYSNGAKGKTLAVFITSIVTLSIFGIIFLLASFAAMDGAYNQDPSAWIQYALTTVGLGLNIYATVAATLSWIAAKRLSGSFSLLAGSYEADEKRAKIHAVLSIVFECLSILLLILTIILE